MSSGQVPSTPSGGIHQQSPHRGVCKTSVFHAGVTVGETVVVGSAEIVGVLVVGETVGKFVGATVGTGTGATVVVVAVVVAVGATVGTGTGATVSCANDEVGRSKFNNASNNKVETVQEEVAGSIFIVIVRYIQLVLAELEKKGVLMSGGLVVLIKQSKWYVFGFFV